MIMITSLFLFIGSVSAGTGNGIVENLLITSDGRVIFSTTSHTGVPSCQWETFKGTWEYTMTTESQKKMTDLLITLVNTNKPYNVTVSGTGNCQFGREKVYFVDADY